MQGPSFEWYDYLSFFIMVAVSVLISIYCGFWKKQDSKEEYLLGGKSMRVFPVTISLISSMISGLTMVAYPADVYKYGSNLVLLCFSVPLTALMYAYIFLPVYFKLEVTNLYEYFEIRFNYSCRLVSSLSFVIVMFLYNPVVIYIPALAFEQATGYKVIFIAPIICAICVFYTTIGGLKAVVWTDTFQFFGMIISSIIVVVIGITTVGGIKTVWETNLVGERLDIFNFKFDLSSRDTFWPIMCGAAIHWCSIIIANQGVYQKCRAVPTLAKSRLCVILFGFGVAVFMLLTVITGNVMYAKYSTCDPLSSKQVYRDDQLLPFFVLEISKRFSGLTGVFYAGIFSAALSTFSSTLNTCASIIYEDFLVKCLSPETKLKREGFILKLIVIIMGVLTTALVLVIEQLNEIVPFTSTAQGVVWGPLLGLCILGALIPFANGKGALAGAVTSFVFLAWMGFGSLLHNVKGVSVESLKPMSVENCDMFFGNFTLKSKEEDVFVLYRVTFWYTVPIGSIITIAIGVIVSLITRKSSKPLNKNLCSTILHRFIS